MCFQVSQAPSAQSVFETASDKHIYNNQGALAKLSHMKCLKQYCLLTKVPNKLPTSVRSLENTILTRVYDAVVSRSSFFVHSVSWVPSGFPHVWENQQ